MIIETRARQLLRQQQVRLMKQKNRMKERAGEYVGLSSAIHPENPCCCGNSCSY